jgi:hypothetical protein
MRRKSTLGITLGRHGQFATAAFASVAAAGESQSKKQYLTGYRRR